MDCPGAAPYRAFLSLTMPYLYLFFLMIAPQLWVPGMVGLPVDMILFPVWLIVLVLTGRFGYLVRFALPDKLLFSFVAWMALGVVLSGMSDLSKDQLYLYLRIAILYKLVSASVTSLADVRRVMWFFVLLAVILAFESIDHKFSSNLRGWAGQSLGWVDPSVLAAGGTGRVRWVGIFDGPGVFCVVFTIALGFVLPLIGGGNRWLLQLSGLVLVALLGWATYLTGSRGGFLATLAVLGLFIAMRRKISASKIIGGALLCALIFMLAPESLTSTRDENKSAQHRVEMWAEGLEMIKENPARGIGRGNFREYTGRLIAHNSAIEIGGETGLVGLMLWGTLIFVCMRAAVMARSRASTPAEANVGFGLLLALVGYLVSAMFVTLEYETWYFLLALCAVVMRDQPEAHLTKRDIALVGGVTAAFVIFLQVFVVAYM